MRPARYTYSIYDAVTDRTILKDGNAHDVQNKIGLHQASIFKYTSTGNIYKNRYYVTSAEIKQEPKPKKESPVFIEKKQKPGDEEFIKRFTEAMDYLKTHYTKERLSRIHFKAVGE